MMPELSVNTGCRSKNIGGRLANPKGIALVSRCRQCHTLCYLFRAIGTSMKLLQRSLVARIIASLLAISGMALISVTLTMAMSNSSRGDAAAINVAGSLRMTVYQMMWALQRLEYAPDEASE